jgi:hypothetical protein
MTGTAAQEKKVNVDLFLGDVKLFLTAAGSDFSMNGSQPVMEHGMENSVLISLFTRTGWVGNIFQNTARQIGSDFEQTLNDNAVITSTALKLIAGAAAGAISGTDYGGSTAEAVNPFANDLDITVQAEKGNINLARQNGLWRAQLSGGNYGI